PALGQSPPDVELGARAKIVLVTTAVSIASYPVLAMLGYRPWVVAAPAACVCVLAAASKGVPVARIARGVSWELVPFLFGVLVLATALARAGVTASLSELYAGSRAPLPTV